jgi:hypothetical protein
MTTIHEVEKAFEMLIDTMEFSVIKELMRRLSESSEDHLLGEIICDFLSIHHLNQK